MKLHNSISMFAGIAALTALISCPVWGQDTLAPTLNRFRLSYRPGFNISASFKDLAVLSPAIAGIDHNYDDGYNRVDSTGNRGNYTWYWGIENADQAPGDGFMYMHTMSSSSVYDRSDDPQHGGEITYNRQLGIFRNCFWGLEAAANFTAVNISDSSSGNVNLVTDRYTFPVTYPWLGTGGRVSPEHIPYSGTYLPKYGQNTPLLRDIPTRSLSQVNATAYRELSADLYGFRLGPYLELPLTKHLAASLSGGLAIGYINSDFSFREAVIDPALIRRGSSSKDDVLVGGYVGTTISWSFNRNVSVFSGLQYQNLGTFSQKANNKESVLDLRNSLFVNVGCGISF